MSRIGFISRKVGRAAAGLWPRLGVTFALLLSLAQMTFGYGPLTHQAVIRLTWEGAVKPALRARFPLATEAELAEARAYAYGGCLIQDLGYFYFSSRFFSDLVHYVRSGDFIEALIDESQSLDEYAFALGALAHYAADGSGHAIAVNRAVPAAYPELQAKYGDQVTYADDPTAHLRVEFAFDVLQVARGFYAPQAHRSSGGFKVPKQVLERAFKKTYGLELKEVFVSLDLALAAYRQAVSKIIPQATRAAWGMKKGEIDRLVSPAACDLSGGSARREDLTRESGTRRGQIGKLDQAAALLFRLIPKAGPFKALAFKVPTPETERMFLSSFNATLDDYRALLGRAQEGHLELQNKDFDTGRMAQAGEYKLADQTYARLLGKLAHQPFKPLGPALRKDILTFYGRTESLTAVNAWTGGRPPTQAPASEVISKGGGHPEQ